MYTKTYAAYLITMLGGHQTVAAKIPGRCISPFRRWGVGDYLAWWRWSCWAEDGENNLPPGQTYSFRPEQQ
jgi:hypothetical protein